MDKEILKTFFAVTINSIYRVVAYGEKGCPYAEKIHANKPGKYFRIGDKMNDGRMLAVAKNLQFYFPEGHSMLSPQASEVRELDRVNTMWWRSSTSSIVALFLSEEEALSCFSEDELKPCDQRWIEETKAVLKKIGEDHPNVTICHWEGLSLL